MVAPSYMELARKDGNADDDAVIDQIDVDVDDDGIDMEENKSTSSSDPYNYYPRRSAFAIGCASFVAGFLLGVMFLGGYRSFLAADEVSYGGGGGGDSSNELVTGEIISEDDRNSTSRTRATISVQTIDTEDTSTFNESDNSGFGGEAIQNDGITNIIVVLKQVNHDRTSFT
jgi:hypothetical protein